MSKQRSRPSKRTYEPNMSPTAAPPMQHSRQSDDSSIASTNLSQSSDSSDVLSNFSHPKPFEMRAGKGLGAVYSSFFNELNYDCRAMIYEYIVPPFEPEESFLGLALSCQQGYDEILEVARPLLEKYKQSFVAKFEKDTGIRLTIRSPIDRSDGYPGLQNIVIETPYTILDGRNILGPATPIEAILSGRLPSRLVSLEKLLPLFLMDFQKISIYLTEYPKAIVKPDDLSRANNDYDLAFAWNSISARIHLSDQIDSAMHTLEHIIVNTALYTKSDSLDTIKTKCLAVVWHERLDAWRLGPVNGVVDGEKEVNDRNGHLREALWRTAGWGPLLNCSKGDWVVQRWWAELTRPASI